MTIGQILHTDVLELLNNKLKRKGVHMDIAELETKVSAELEALKNTKMVEAIDAEIETVKAKLVTARAEVDGLQGNLDGLVAERDSRVPAPQQDVPVVEQVPTEPELAPVE